MSEYDSQLIQEQYFRLHRKRVEECAPERPYTDKFFDQMISMENLSGLIMNGGWCFIYQCEKRAMIPQARDGYLAIGAPKHAASCDRVMRVVGEIESRHPNVDTNSEDWLIDGLMQSIDEDLWESFDDEWCDTEDCEDCIELMGAYVFARSLHIDQPLTPNG